MTTDSKDIVLRGLAALMETGDVTALAPSLSEDFVHRRPGANPSTKSEWLAAVRAAQVPLAGMQIEVQHVLADGDHVVVHSRRRLPGGGPEIAVIDICRVGGGLVTEICEIIEPVAEVDTHRTWWKAA
jgi:ketosteroid isomerase-like protein